jgi:hypothetical protein
VPGRSAMTWSDAGNLLTDGRGWTYTHDGHDRLVRAQNTSGTDVTPGSLIQLDGEAGAGLRCQGLPVSWMRNAVRAAQTAKRPFTALRVAELRMRD